MDRIPIIEDDPETAAAIRHEAEALGCQTDHCDTLPSGIEAATTGQYNVIVLDRMLPGGDGVNAMARIRAGGATALILILSNPKPSTASLAPSVTAPPPATASDSPSSAPSPPATAPASPLRRQTRVSRLKSAGQGCSNRTDNPEPRCAAP